MNTFSISQISSNLFNNCSSPNLEYLKIAQRDWIGSIILFERLQASANRVVFEKISIVRRKACCAEGVILSASSSITILCLPGGRVTF